MSSKQLKILAVVGSTASGKTALSVALAKSAAVIAEALRAGMDEVTVLVPDLSEAQISTLLQFSEVSSAQNSTVNSMIK